VDDVIHVVPNSAARRLEPARGLAPWLEQDEVVVARATRYPLTICAMSIALPASFV